MAPVQRDRGGDQDGQDNVAWATSLTSDVEQVQDEAHNALERLGDDAGTAVDHLRDCQGHYDRFEEMYYEAVADFIAGVEAAQAQAEEFRENVKWVATSMLAVVAPTASAMYSAMDSTLTNVQRATSILSGPQPAGPASESTSPGMAAAQRDGRLDWSELLSTALDTFDNTLERNDSLHDLSRTCIDTVRFLDSVQEGRYSGDDPRSAELGAKAQQMSTDKASILQSLRSIGEGTVSGPSETLKERIAERVGGITKRRLEQDIAIRWMGGLGGGLDTAAHDLIDDAEAYLSRIGVFDAGDNRLGHDTGLVTDAYDESLLQGRAHTEATAMGLLGSTGSWLGNPFVPNEVTYTEPTRFGPGRCIEPRAYSGQVRDTRGREWRVDVPRGAPPDGGGPLLLTGYRVEHQDSSDVSWGDYSELMRGLRREIVFTGQPAGQLGGGAVADDGPSFVAPE